MNAIAIAELLDFVRSDWAKLPQWVRDAYESHLLMIAPDHIVIRTAENYDIGIVGKWLFRDGEGKLRIMNFSDMIRLHNKEG